MSKSRLNRDWHQTHKMPARATFEQRLQWHLEHAEHCTCRPIPQKLLEEMEKKGISMPNLALKSDAPKSRRAP